MKYCFYLKLTNLYILKFILYAGAFIMVKFGTFSRFKDIFSRLNPLNSFEWNIEQVNIKSISSDNLLEKIILNYLNFEIVILVAIYHLFNTKNVSNEFLTVLSKDNKIIVDLMEGDENNVKIPHIVKMSRTR